MILAGSFVNVVSSLVLRKMAPRWREETSQVSRQGAGREERRQPPRNWRGRGREGGRQGKERDGELQWEGGRGKGREKDRGRSREEKHREK